MRLAVVQRPSATLQFTEGLTVRFVLAVMSEPDGVPVQVDLRFDATRVRGEA
jgi:hypothetical protein